MGKFNEDTRVKLPALLHLTRLGYRYIPQAEHHKRERESNIFPEIFMESLTAINGNAYQREDYERLLQDITLELDNEDLGEKFYERLVSTSGIKLIDFENFERNSFHVTTELPCKNEDDEFRPDITLLINGMPLVFIEVKRPHNKEGVLAERERMNKRFKNKKFRRFVNVTQLMVFSNNMEYEDGVIDPLFGAFYASSAYGSLNFNFFREDPDFPVRQNLIPLDDELENFILHDSNLITIKHNAEFKTNKDENTPTHRILTSLFTRERLAFILRYGIAYVRAEDKHGKQTIQKHIMRYPQLFGTKAIAKKLDEGKKRGIIWHTQGSGKTALAYFNVKHLTDYFQKKNIIPKFYFIVDRLDLLNQASTEFSNRGLIVNRVNSRDEFAREFMQTRALHNDSGKPEITVVNIHKFSEESSMIALPEYDIKVQRIFFLDEAHRSYNPTGNFLANLINSDRDAIMIALTGTPLLKEVAKTHASTTIFGEYIHKYYYNMSIADGYTLRLIREEIQGNFRMQMQKIMEDIKIIKGEIKTSDVFAHPSFVKPMLEYITEDLIQFRKDYRDDSLGGMVVCDSSAQARELFEQFKEKYPEEKFINVEVGVAAGGEKSKNPYFDESKLTAALILHDENDTETRKDQVKAFKKGEIDLLFVYNMLLTGFDAHRLKKLYLARVVQDHNLLQTLTRVNRPYKKFKYGYVVDFADISKAFDRTNQLYFNELQQQLGDEFKNYENLFISPDEIEQAAREIKEALFHYDLENLEIFSRQISEIHDKNELYRLVKALNRARELKNAAIGADYENLKELLDFNKLNKALIEARNRLDNLNLLSSLERSDETQFLLNEAIENILFQFIKVGEEELTLADEYRELLRRTRESLGDNIDKKDIEFINLKNQLEEIFKKKNLMEITREEIRKNSKELTSILDFSNELNRKNNLLSAKYRNDEKYARIHKRLMEKQTLDATEMKLNEALTKLKEELDSYIEGQREMVLNEEFLKQSVMKLVVDIFKKQENISMDYETAEKINRMVVNEYIREYTVLTA